jgi:hypothetical protein
MITISLIQANLYEKIMFFIEVKEKRCKGYKKIK